MDNPILYQGVGGLLIVFFLVLIYFFTRTWRWFHIVCVVLVFGASIFWLRNVAAVYRTLNAWRSLVTKSTIQLEKLAEENDLLLNGKFDDTQQIVESARLLHAKLERVNLDRGRVWRNCTPAAPQPDGTITVSTLVPGAEVAAPPAEPVVAPPVAPPPPAAPGAAAPPAPAPKPAAPTGPPPNRIQEQTVLYVFLEGVPPPETGVPAGVKVPQYYIGDFVTVAVTDTSVTLRPLSPLSNFDVNVLRTLPATWTLHDTMPVDGHEWFAEDPDRQPNLNQPADIEPAFGKMNETAIKAMFTWPRFLPEAFSSPAEFQYAVARLNADIEKYIRDGKSVPVANKDDFPPLMVWAKVRFLKAHKEAVDSNATVSPFSPGVTDDFFDRGLAEVAILKLGKEAEFEVGDVGLFPQENAEQLIAAGICEFREYVFVRPLNDYAFLFRHYDKRFDRIRDDREKVERDIAELKSAQANIDSQLAMSTTDQTKLQQDLAKTQEEAVKITEYLATLEKHWADTRTMLSALYRVNLQLDEELKRLYQKMSDEINRRINQSVAGK